MKAHRDVPFNVILLGDPASGKATQAARLAKRYRLYDFDMGRELRRPSVRASFDYDGMSAKGALAPTNVVRGIIRRTIQRVPASKGILFDGHPKMIGEAKIVASLLHKTHRRDPLVIYLRIPAADVLQRIKKRARDDDTPSAIKGRRRYYRTQISKVVDFFKKRYAFSEVSGEGTRDAVAGRIRKIVESHATKNA